MAHRLGKVLLASLVLAMLLLAMPLEPVAAKSSPDGFTKEVRMTYSAQGDFFPAVVVDQQDNVHMIWLNGTGRDLDNRQVQNGVLYYAKYSPYGDTFVPPMKLLDTSTDGKDFVASPPAVAIYLNSIFVTWADNHDKDVSTVYLIRLDLWGHLQTVVNTITNTTNAKYPDVAVDRNGDVHLAWAQWEMLGGESLYSEIFYMKLGPDGRIKVPRTTVTTTFLASNHPSLAIDQDLNAHIIFEENVNAPGPTDQLYYCVVDQQGHVKMSMQRVTSTNGQSLRPDIAFDRNDRLRMVWEEVHGTQSGIYYAEVGEPGHYPMLRVSSGTDSSYDPRLVIDTDLSTDIVWSQNVYSGPIDNSRVWYAPVGADGTVETEPTTLTYGGLGAKAPAIALDGYGNVIVAWDDYRKDPVIGIEVWDVYYMRTVIGVNLEPIDVLEVNGAPFNGGDLDFIVNDEAVFYAGNSTDPNAWDQVMEYNFTVVHGNMTFYSGWSENATLDYKFTEPGDYVIYVKVKDTFGYKNSRPKAALARVTEKKASTPVTILENPRIRTTVVASGIGVAATLGYLVAGTEIGKYNFLTLMLVPLYSRIKRENTLDNYIRGQIHGYILAKPGCHYNQIKQTLNLNNGTLAYHLRKLEREEFIKSVRDGMYKRFYPVGLKIPKREIKLSAMQERILDIIRQHPGISQKEVAGEVGISAPAVIYHIGVLAGAKLVRSDKVGSRMEYRALERPEDEWELPTDQAPTGSGH